MSTSEQAKIDAFKFLRASTTAVVATSFNDEPRASTVYYYLDNNFNFYFVTKRNTSKYVNIEMNPRAALVVGTGPEHITVQAHGAVELIVEDSEKEKIMNMFIEIAKRENIKNWPIEQLQNFKDRNKVVFKISPEQVLFMNLDSSLYPNSIGNDYVEVFSNIS